MTSYRKNVIGIDPGAGGAAFEIPRLDLLRFKKDDDMAVAAWLGCIQYIWKDESVFYLERVNERPGEAHQFTFGFNCGKIYGMLLALQCDVKLVEPKAWQNHFGLGGRAKSCRHNPHRACESCAYVERKRRHRAKAAELFPDIKVTLDAADAMLIAMYGFHMENGYAHQKPVDSVRVGTGIVRHVNRTL